MSEVLLPPSASAQERAMDLATARVGDVPSTLRELWDADACPAALLPWLAWAYSLDDWNPSWSPAQQRQAIKNAVAVHRYKGTIGAVKDALAALGFEVAVQEWFNQVPEGEPYTFRLLVNVQQNTLDFDDLQRVLEVIQYAKNLRSHMDVITPTITSVAGPVIAAVASTGTEENVEYVFDEFPDLLMEGAINGFPQTEAAVDALHTLLHVTMPAPNYW